MLHEPEASESQVLGRLSAPGRGDARFQAGGGPMYPKGRGLSLARYTTAAEYYTSIAQLAYVGVFIKGHRLGPGLPLSWQPAVSASLSATGTGSGGGATAARPAADCQ